MTDAKSRFAESTQSAAGKARRAATVLGLSMFAAFALLAGPVSAQGAVIHQYSSSVPLSNYPVSIAVDKSTNDFYVLSVFPSRLSKFDENGNPSNFSSLGTNQIELAGPMNNQEPLQLAIDNTGGPNQGVIYIGNQIQFPKTGILMVYAPSGDLIQPYFVNTDLANGGHADCGVATAVNGDVWVAHEGGLFHTGGYIDKFHPGQWIIGASPPQTWPVLGTGEVTHRERCEIGVTSKNGYYQSYGTSFGFAGTGPLEKYSPSSFFVEVPHGKTIDTGVHGFTVDQSNDDVYSVRGSEIAKFDANSLLREQFGVGKFEFATSIGVNPNNKNAYVGVIVAGGAEAPQIQIYKSVIVPDINEVSATAYQTVANLKAEVGTAGAGNVIACELEYGPTTSYGTTVPCSPATPYSSTKEVSVHLEGLSKETTYHYRFTAANANGTLKDIDGTFTTHNVAEVKTEEATNITQTSATLNGSYNGSTTNTPPFYTLENYLYYFEWGTQAGVYTHKTAVPPGVDAGAHSGIVHVSADITGLTTYLPESSAYHYRIVVTNSSGTTYGPDVAFFSAPPDPPAVSNTSASEATTNSAKIAGEINPGNGDTIYTIEYGATPYESFTPISESIGDDNTNHAVSQTLTGLEPGTTYHYRIVATNFGGTGHSTDGTFTTKSPPSPPPVEQQQGGGAQPSTPPGGGGGTKPVKCKKGFVKKHGKCVKKKPRKHHKRKHHG